MGMKRKASKLDAHGARLEEWFLGGKTLAEAQALLKAEGCAVSLSRLSDWWQARQNMRQEEVLLGQIASGARQCRDVEAAFGKDPAPELETIIKLQRVLIMRLSVSAHADPELLDLVARLTKPAMEWAKLSEKRAERELAEQKYRDVVSERKRALEAEVGKARAGGGLTEETLQKIEAELRLL